MAGLKIQSLRLPPGEQYGEVFLHGKTGLRQVTFIRGLPYLRDWLRMHPHAGRPEAPLWAVIRGSEVRGLSYRSLQSVFAKAARAAGLPLSAHDLRHGRATEASQANWAEAKMRQFFGWRPGSKMPSRYVHIAGLDTRNQVLIDAGVEPKEKIELQGLPRMCPNCGHQNTGIAAQCVVCWFPLVQEEAERVQEVKEALAAPHVRRLLEETEKVAHAVHRDLAEKVERLESELAALKAEKGS